MSTVAGVLRTLIVRISRGEVRQATVALRKSNREMRQTVAALKRRCSALEKGVQSPTARRAGSSALGAVEVDDDAMKSARPTGPMIKALRRKLGLSRRQFGLLLGVTGQSVLLWEQKSGRLRMRKANLKALVQLRQMGKREIRAALEVAEG